MFCIFHSLAENSLQKPNGSAMSRLDNSLQSKEWLESRLDSFLAMSRLDRL